MALYGGERDISLLRSLNRELIHRIIDTEVLIYKLNLNATNVNLYDETDNKVYDQPILMPCLVAMEEQTWTAEDFGPDNTQMATFAFLIDDLVSGSVLVEVGDTIEYKSRFFEIDNVVDNQHFVGKDPDNWFGGNSHGWSVGLVCSSHSTRQSRLNIVETRFGNSHTSNDVILPEGL